MNEGAKSDSSPFCVKQNLQLAVMYLQFPLLPHVWASDIVLTGHELMTMEHLDPE